MPAGFVEGESILVSFPIGLKIGWFFFFSDISFLSDFLK